MGREHPDVAALEPIYLDLCGSIPFSWAEHVVLMRIEPDALDDFEACFPVRHRRVARTTDLLTLSGDS